MELQDQIQQAITKNLPAEVGASLQAELKALANLRERSAEDRRLIDNLEERNAELRKRIESLEAELTNRDEVLRLKQECDERARNWDLEIANVRLEAANNSGKMLREVVRDVFHSPVYRTRVERKTETPTSYDSNGNFIGCETLEESVQTERTVD